MTLFIHEDFLLASPVARRLYHEVAAPLPIIDYHNHLDARALLQDRPFPNLAQLWIASDPYKHRAMRIAGVPEHDVTGPADDRTKFNRYAATVPIALGNPLYAWTALELKRCFAIDAILSPATADDVWRRANELLATPDFAPRRLLSRANVACACTSDLLLDDLSAHAALAAVPDCPRVVPSLRADDVLATASADYPAWARRLADATGIPTADYDGLRAAVARRIDAFDQLGCRLADHGIDDLAHLPTDDDAAADLYATRLAAGPLPPHDDARLRSALLRFLSAEYRRRGWTLQLHLGAQRRTSSRLRRLAGPAGGYAAMNNPADLRALATLLDDLELSDALPRVILFSLNPALFPALATLTGSFAEDGVPGKLQLGPAWWYNDHAAGMRQHLESLASHGLLATFVGMTTDSRSLLSMTRHEYFRRILCQWIGENVAAGHFPADLPALAALVRALCHDNAATMLGLSQPLTTKGPTAP